MAEELISGYIDEAAFLKQTDFAEAQLKRLVAQYDALKGVKLELQGAKSIDDITVATKKAQLEIAELRKRNLELAVSAKEVAAANKLAAEETRKNNEAAKKAAADATDAAKERIQQLKEEQAAIEKVEADLKARNAAEHAYDPTGNFNSGSSASKKAQQNTAPFIPVSDLQVSIAEVTRLQATIKSLDAEILANAAAFKKGEISEGEYDALVNKNTISIARNKAAIADLNKTIKDSVSVTQVLTKEQKLQQAVDATERNSLGRAQALILQYTNAKKSLNLATAEGARLNDNYNKAIDNTNKFILKNADAVTTQAKNVGNYAGSLGGFFNKLLGPLRTIANIVPGLGLGGIFLLAFEGISAAASAMGLFNSKLADSVKIRETYNEVLLEANKQQAQEQTQLKLNRQVIEDVTVPMETRLQAIKNIKAEYPEYFKGLKDEDLLNGKVGDAYDKAAEAIIRKARAQAAAAKIAEIENKKLDIILQSELDAEKAREKIRKATAGTDVVSGGGFSAPGASNVSLTKRDVQSRLVEEFNLKKKAGQDEVNLLNEKEKKLLELTEDGFAETIKIDKAKADKKIAITKQSTKEVFDAEVEDAKRLLQKRIAIEDEVVSDSEASYAERIDALKVFGERSERLIELNADVERATLLTKQKELQANLSKAKGTEANNIKKELEDNAQRILDIDNKANNERISLADLLGKKLLQIQKDNNKKAVEQEKSVRKDLDDAFAEQAEAKKTGIEKQYSSDIVALNDSFTSNLLTEKEYNKKRLKLDFDYAVDKLELEIETTRQIIQLRKIRGEDVSKEEAALAGIEAKLSDLKLKRFKDIEKQKRDAVIETFQKIKDIGEQLFGLLDGLINANTIAQKNALKEQQDAAEKKAAKDIEIINASAISEEEKAARITIVNARLQAQKEQFALRERQINEQKAKAEKARAIFEITINTAIAVAKALPNVFAAIAVGILGAAQLAIAIATPIPKFWHGKNAKDSYEGMGIWDEGGKREVKVDGNTGAIEMGTGRGRVDYIKRNDIIFPSVDAFAKSAFHVAHDGAIVSAPQVQQQQQQSNAKVEAYLKQLVNKPTSRTYASDKGMENVIAWGTLQRKYSEDNTNW